MNVKIAQDLFMEVAEINRLKRSLIADGINVDVKANYENFGIICNQNWDPNFNFFKVDVIDVLDTIRVKPGFAYDKNRNVLTSIGVDIVVPQRNIFYWLKVKHKYTSVEEGTVTIGGTNGGLFKGVNTKFLEVLRGQPNFAAKISFTNSILYTQEYEISEVIDDVTAYVQGYFPSLESGLKYRIVGTFSGGKYPTTEDKYPFQYDDFDYELVQEVNFNTQPDINFVDEEFFIARLVASSTDVKVEDKRYNFISKTRPERLLSEVPTETNPLIAIESVSRISIRNKLTYVVTIAWGFKIISEQRNANLNKVTITNGSGGLYKSTNAFQNNNFDNWRYYYADGSYSRIISSIKNSIYIELQLEFLKPDSGVMICPNSEEVEVSMHFGLSDVNVYKIRRQSFYSFTDKVQVEISEDEIESSYKKVALKHRYKTMFRLTPEKDFNPNTYNLQGLGDITNKDIILTASGTNSNTGTGGTEWHGINPFCMVNNLGGDVIYYKLDLRNSTVQPTSYLPDSSTPFESLDKTTSSMYVQFFSDVARTIPMSLTMNNLQIVVKRKEVFQTTAYDSPTVGVNTTTDGVYENIFIYSISPASENEKLLGIIETSKDNYEHPTGIIGTRRIIYAGDFTFFTFPSNNKVIGGNTGQSAFSDLEEIDINTQLPTGAVKPNVLGDPNYILPVDDSVNCSYEVKSISVGYGYALNIKKVLLTGTTSTPQNSTLIANTGAGMYGYVLEGFLPDEQITVTVKAATLDAQNNTGKVWVRVIWRPLGATSDIQTQLQINNDTETILSTIFKNIVSIRISNY